jgi:hypothetical protein
MEENKKIQVNNKILYTDTSPEFQPEGTSRFRLNAVPETNLGEQGNFSNELGNLSKIQLPNQNIIIGHIPILEDKTIIFSVRQDNSNSEIGIWNETTEDYSSLINANCLDFKITNQVRGIFRVREGCNTNIYFTDFTNPWRVIDIDNIGQYLIDQSNTPLQTRINNANSTGLGWDCNSFKLFRDYNITNVDMQVFNTGGNTKVGMYQFTYQYLDDDFNPQPWNTPTNPIPIVKDSLNEYITLDGDITGTNTNKSIQIQINNIDTRYSYVRIGLIVSDLGTGFNSNAYILEEVPVENNSITYLFSGLDPNKTQNTDLESFQYLPPDYYTGKDLTQIDNSLVLAYPKAKNIDYVPFIQSALNIKSRYYIKDIFAEATGENSFGNRYPNNYFYNKSLMRDEVYSFGVVWVFDDGTETPAFHIPGRAKDRFSFDNTLINPIFYENELIGGNTNPAFNLHNRAKTTEYGGNGSAWDSVKYNSNLDEIKSNLVDIRQTENNQVERWKVFNTAIRLDYSQQQDNPGYFISKGELAYWESQDYTYPATTDCTGQPIYGDLVGTKVRYHKMPDATLEPHYYGYSNKTNPTSQDFATIRPLNIEFFNIEIPTQYIDEIQGYRIVRVERNTFNSSVADKGLMYQNEPFSEKGRSNELGVTQNFPFNRRLNAIQNALPTTLELEEDYYRWFTEDYFNSQSKGTKHKSIHSPTTKVNKDSAVADYIKIERTLFASGGADFTIYNRGVRDDNDRVYYDEIADNYYRLGQNDVWHGEVGVRYNNSDIPKSLSTAPWQKNLTNRIINSQGYVEAGFNKTGLFNYPFYNKTQNETFAVELGGLNNTYGDISTGGDFSNSYTPVGLGFLKAGASASADVDGNASFGGQPTNLNRELAWNTINNNSFSSLRETAFYVSLKRYLPNQYNGISQQIYTVPSDISTTNTYIYSDGDCFINDWAFKKYCEFSDEGNDTGYRFLEDFKTQTSSDFITLRSLNRFWCESPINMELRYSEEDVVNSYYDNIGNDTDELHKTKWYAPKNYQDGNNMVDFLLPEVAWNEGRFATVRNFYGYNKDFSIENTVRAFFPLPINYDYCNECRVKFPHRLVNSNKAYQEERADNYRVFLPNNYRDIPGETGSINEVFIKNNKLFIHTTQSLWLQQVKPQQIKTDQATLYVGTGEFWEIPPNEVVTSTNGYAGCQHQLSTINTPFGYFWVSERERKIFLFNDKLDEISNRGLRNWFENNIPFNLNPAFINLLNSSSDNPSNPNSVGFTVSYDKRYRRIILTKRDYTPLNIPGLIFNFFTNQWQLGERVVLPYEEPTLFENKSWTISYHPDSEGFISWHSYLPYYMFNTQNHFYTFKDNEGFKHNEGNFQTYYDLKYPYIVEYTVPYQTTNLIDTINFYNKVYSFDATTNNWIEQPLSTYDKVIVYNDNQATPEMNIVVTNNTPFQSVLPTTVVNPIFVTKAEQDWNISGFIDYTNDVNESIFTNDWAALQDQYYIDKVINTNKIDTTQSPFDLQQFRGKFINYRLSTNNLNNYKFVSKYDTTGFRTSDR